MSFENYFVRISCDLLKEDHTEFFKLGISPELYMDSCGLNHIANGLEEEFADILGKFPSHTIHAPFLDISTGGYDDDIRELSFQKLARVLELGKSWKTSLVVIHYNYDRLYYRESLKRWLARSVDFFKRLTESPDHPVIAMENIDDPAPDVALELEERVGRNRIIHCFDYGHHHVFGRIGSTEWLDRLRSEKSIHFHFHDNDGSGDDHLPLGEGKINWMQAKKDIQGLNMDFSVTLEPHSKENMLRSLKYYRENFLSVSNGR